MRRVAPTHPAYIVVDGPAPRALSWAQYHERSSLLASLFAQAGLRAR